MNHFEIFNLPQGFDIDQTNLTKSYFDLQAKYHPDKYNGPDISSNINSAYKILKDDVARAEYLLQIMKIELPNLDFVELESLMEENEKVEEARDKTELDNILIENDAKIKECKSKISAAFSENNQGVAAKICAKMKYIDRIIQNIKIKIKSL
jgi:molecular chaperone HscB